MGEVRAAAPGDVEQIVELARAGLPGRALPYTVFDASGITAFLRDRIGSDAERDDGGLIVFDDRGVDGFAEFRHVDGALFLNHVYVHPDRRRGGIGRRLIHAGVQRFRRRGEEELALDVFSDNWDARRWYMSMGLARISLLEWRVAGLVPLEGASPWRAVGLEEADAAHARYGFSEFQLAAKDGTTYRVGRLGSTAYRLRDVGLLADRGALGALASLGRAPRVVCIAPPEPFATRAPRAALVAKSLRMAGPLAGVLAATAPRRAGPPPRRRSPPDPAALVDGAWPWRE